MSKGDRDLLGKIVENVHVYGRTILGENLIFSSIFGSLAYNLNTKNDVDLSFVIKHRLNQKTRDKLIKSYIQLHEKFNLNPDLKYPGEYILLDDLKHAQRGRGFVLDKNKLFITKIFNCAGWNSFNDYRHHLTAIGGPTIFVGGDYNEYLSQKDRCLRTLVDIVLLSTGISKFNINWMIDAIIDSGKPFLGFSDNVGTRTYLYNKLGEQFENRVSEGVFERVGESFTIKSRNSFDSLFANLIEYNRRGNQQ